MLKRPRRRPGRPRTRGRGQGRHGNGESLPRAALATAKACHDKALELKDNAKSQWTHGITAARATDIHSNLGYAYQEANDLDTAEWHLKRAVKLKPISSRPRNNLGRVLLRRSQDCEAKEAKP